MFTSDDFLAETERFLTESGMSASRFGREALGDPRFISDLRAGRSPSLDVVMRVLKFIKKQGDAAA